MKLEFTSEEFISIKPENDREIEQLKKLLLETDHMLIHKGSDYEGLKGLIGVTYQIVPLDEKIKEKYHL